MATIDGVIYVPGDKPGSDWIAWVDVDDVPPPRVVVVRAPLR